MRKVLVSLTSLFLCIVLIIGLVGCGMKSENIKLSQELQELQELQALRAISKTTATPVPTATPVLVGIQKYMQDRYITLTAKDVQFDMVNNLDKNFAIEGTAELSDYYNYKFVKAEKTFFCIKVRPVGGSYTDEWYIYCSRETKKDIFNKLKNDGKIPIIASCVLPKDFYTEGQGNLAFAIQILTND